MTAPAERIPRGRGKGEWWPLKLHDGRLSASLRCPGCGEKAALDGHAIAGGDGTVTPSVACPTVGCGFHAIVRLDGWG